MIEIRTIQDLQNIDNDLNGEYVLVNDIDASETSSWNNGDGFHILGYPDGFSGKLYGNGHKITNLYMKVNRYKYGGLFYKLNNGAVIEGIILIDINIDGTEESNESAGMVCYNYGEISKCGITGKIEGGCGIAGFCYENHGRITNCYAGVDLTGGSELGGFLSNNTLPGFVDFCFSYGAVPHKNQNGEPVEDAGGFSGLKGNGTVTHNCYWDKETSGWDTSVDGIGRTHSQMLSKLYYPNYDFVDIWYINDHNDYPRLRINYDVCVTIDVERGNYLKIKTSKSNVLNIVMQRSNEIIIKCERSNNKKINIERSNKIKLGAKKC